MLKTAGFLKKHNKSFTCAQQEYKLLNAGTNSDICSADICQYLDNGHTVIAFLHYTYDGEVPIAPAVICTDGVWIWPAYYTYYIKKHPDIDIPTELILHITQNNFTVPKVNNESREYLQYLLFTKIMNEKIKNEIKLSPSLIERSIHLERISNVTEYAINVFSPHLFLLLKLRNSFARKIA